LAETRLPTLHRYLRLAKRLLGISASWHYTTTRRCFRGRPFPSSVLPSPERITVAPGTDGDEYRPCCAGFAGRWMNALPRQGKAAGHT